MGERLSDEQTRAMINGVNGYIRIYSQEIKQRLPYITDGTSVEEVRVAYEIKDLSEVIFNLRLFKLGLRVALGEVSPAFTLTLRGKQLRFDGHSEIASQEGAVHTKG